MGERKPEVASYVVRQSLVLGAVLGLLTGALFAIFAKPLLGLLGADEAVASAGAPYLAAVGGLNVFQTVSIIGVSAMRAAGDTRTPMWLSALGSGLTVPAVYLLVSVAGLGIMGAAVAQVAVGIVFFGATLWLLWRGSLRGETDLGGGDKAMESGPAIFAGTVFALFGAGLLAWTGSRVRHREPRRSDPGPDRPWVGA